MAGEADSRQAAAAEIADAVRGFSGGMLFGIPLLYTMEVWWVGTHTTPVQMLFVLAATFGVVFLLNLTGGFKGRDAYDTRAVLADSVEALAIGLLSAAAVLVLLREVTPATPLPAALGKVTYEAMPFALGVSLARHFLSGDRVDPDGEARREPTGRPEVDETVADLGAAAVGAVFVALNIAPTDEVPMLATALGPAWVAAVAVFSIVVTYVIVFAAGFANTAGRRRQEGVLQHPLTETMAAYVISLLMAALMLALFQNLDVTEPWPFVLGKVVVLGLPAAVGGAAGRLAV